MCYDKKKCVPISVQIDKGNEKKSHNAIVMEKSVWHFPQNALCNNHVIFYFINHNNCQICTNTASSFPIIILYG